MSEPLVVSIPHRLGRDEAVRRIKSGFGQAHAHFAHLLTISEETWDDSRLSFRASALGQAASGLIDVRDDHVVLTVQLGPGCSPGSRRRRASWISREGTLMLEKK